MARTSIQLVSTVLSELRNAASKTQEEIGLYLRDECGQKFNKAKHDALAFKRAAVSTYQRIERTGRTSPNTAKAIAKYFNVSLAALKGAEPIDSLESLIKLLDVQHQSGHNVKFNYEYAKILTSEPWTVKEGDPLPLHQSKSKWRRQFAESIGIRIESVQWRLNLLELSYLAKITGAPEEDLLKPIFVRDFWWVTSSLQGDSVGCVVSGNPSQNISAALKKHPQFSRDITTIHLSKNEYTYRFDLTFFNPKTGDKYLPQWFEFTPCAPNKNEGIRWLKSYPHKHEQHKKWCTDVALRYADSVYDFNKKLLSKNGGNSDVPVFAFKEEQK